MVGAVCLEIRRSLIRPGAGQCVLALRSSTAPSRCTWLFLALRARACVGARGGRARARARAAVARVDLASSHYENCVQCWCSLAT